MKPKRKIVVDNLAYFWACGRTMVEIRGPEEFTDKLFVFDKITPTELVGVPDPTYERGQHKGSTDGMVLPSQVAAFIKAHPIHKGYVYDMNRGRYCG